MTPNPTAAWMGDVMRLAVTIADRAVLELIESEAFRGGPGADEGWLDVRPMVSEHEHSPRNADLNRAYLSYADTRRLITRHPADNNRVRIVRRP